MELELDLLLWIVAAAAVVASFTLGRRKPRTDWRQARHANYVPVPPRRNAFASTSRASTVRSPEPQGLECRILSLPPQRLRALTQGQFDELAELAASDPREALRRIEALPGAERRLPIVRFIRIYALGNLIWGDAPERPDFDMDACLRELSREARGFAEEGVREIGALERDVPDFFARHKLENAANRVCLPHEVSEECGVQRRLGWTKISYLMFSDGRYFEVDRDKPSAEQLRDLPVEVWGNLADTRFRCPHAVMASVLFRARREAYGWTAFYIVGTEKMPGGGQVRDIAPVGYVAIHEDSRTQFVSRQGEQSLAFASAALVKV